MLLCVSAVPDLKVRNGKDKVGGIFTIFTTSVHMRYIPVYCGIIWMIVDLALFTPGRARACGRGRGGPASRFGVHKIDPAYTIDIPKTTQILTEGE